MGEDVLPVVHVISDSVGATARQIARAAAAQFGVTNPAVETLAKARTFADIKGFIDEHAQSHHRRFGEAPMLVYYTIVDRSLQKQLADYAVQRGDVIAVDLMTSAVEAMARASGLTPSTRPGYMHVPDQHYYRRIEAVEFTIAHDDGRNPQDLPQADIVLIGVSRTSKTPLSIYLSQQGYKVANIPLDVHTDPPKELAEVEKTRLFGLMTSADVLINIRRRRLGNAGAVAASYADPEYVYRDLEESRALMRKLGCIVVHTENRAVEETAQEILRYYERAHPPAAQTTA